MWNVKINQSLPFGESRKIDVNSEADLPGTAMMAVILELKVNEEQITEIKVEKL